MISKSFLFKILVLILVPGMFVLTEGVMLPHKQGRALTRGSLGPGLQSGARQVGHGAAPTQVKWSNLDKMCSFKTFSVLIVYLLLLPGDWIVLRPPELLVLGVGHPMVIDGPRPRSH